MCAPSQGAAGGEALPLGCGRRGLCIEALSWGSCPRHTPTLLHQEGPEGQRPQTQPLPAPPSPSPGASGSERLSQPSGTGASSPRRWPPQTEPVGWEGQRVRGPSSLHKVGGSPNAQSLWGPSLQTSALCQGRLGGAHPSCWAARNRDLEPVCVCVCEGQGQGQMRGAPGPPVLSTVP